MEGRLVVLEPDLMFSSRIESAAAKCGLTVEVKLSLDRVLEVLKVSSPIAVLVNLDALEDGTRALVTSLPERCRLIGYYSHVNFEIAREALAVGFLKVLPRRTFVEKLSELLSELGSA